MEKEFDAWNENKKRAHANDEYLPLYHEREIRWCRLGINIGFEQDGTGQSFSRPVLVLKGFSRRVCIVAPLTTSSKRNGFYLSIGEVDGKSAAVIISQIRLIDTRRLDQHIATLETGIFQHIRKAARDLF